MAETAWRVAIGMHEVQGHMRNKQVCISPPILGEYQPGGRNSLPRSSVKKMMLCLPLCNDTERLINLIMLPCCSDCVRWPEGPVPCSCSRRRDTELGRGEFPGSLEHSSPETTIGNTLHLNQQLGTVFKKPSVGNTLHLKQKLGTLFT
jgi:hypothetical protein